MSSSSRGSSKLPSVRHITSNPSLRSRSTICSPRRTSSSISRIDLPIIVTIARWFCRTAGCKEVARVRSHAGAMMFIERHPNVRWSRWCLPLLLIASAPAWADPAVRVGAHGGVDVGDGTDPHAGVDLRLSFSRSPLTISPTFDYVFDDKMTLYKVSVNALYYLAVPLEHVNPYVGIGFDVTAFSFKESGPGP